MSIEPGDILRDTRPEPVEGIDGRFRAHLPEAWRIFYAFGGATMATALRAATIAVARDDLELVSTDATFCAAIPCGPVAAQVEVLRQGRSGAQALVRLWALDPEQGDPTGPVGNDLVVTCVFGARTASGFDFVGAVPPDVPGPEACPERQLEPGSPFASIPYHAQTDFRLTGADLAWGTDVPPGRAADRVLVPLPGSADRRLRPVGPRDPCAPGRHPRPGRARRRRQPVRSRSW